MCVDPLGRQGHVLPYAIKLAEWSPTLFLLHSNLAEQLFLSSCVNCNEPKSLWEVPTHIDSYNQFLKWRMTSHSHSHCGLFLRMAHCKRLWYCFVVLTSHLASEESETVMEWNNQHQRIRMKIAEEKTCFINYMRLHQTWWSINIFLNVLQLL